jgi:cytochrome c biogenesis protein CcmG/thiol:disulfide interchange protein DsbE
VLLVAIALAVVAVIAGVSWAVIADSGSTEPKTSPMSGSGRASVRGIATVGETAPDFELQTLDGKTVRLSDYRGKPVVVNFWASYCIPCRAEFPMIRKALKAHDNDFVVLGVDYKDIDSDARAFARQQHATWPILTDPGNATGTAYGVRAVPQTFFIGRDGKISQRYYAEVPADLFEQELAKIAKPTTTVPG